MAHDDFNPPNKQEVKILSLLSEGRTQKDVAAIIFRSLRTVQTYTYQMRRRYRCGSTGQLLLKANKRGWIE